MDVQTEMIQPGWSVYAADGEELGDIAGVDEQAIVVRSRGLLGSKEYRVPKSAVREVETGRVELSISKEEVRARS